MKKQEDSQTESILSEDLESMMVALDPKCEDSEGSSGNCSSNRLFVGIIDINKCEEDERFTTNCFKRMTIFASSFCKTFTKLK